VKDRASIVFLEYGQIDVVDGAFVLIDGAGVRVQIPVGGLACLMLEPGTRISHAAVALAARLGCLLVWVGEGAVRLYSSGQPGGARADRLLYQARCALDETARLNVVREMFRVRFGETAPPKRSVDQLRGIEGVRVRTLYQGLARQYGVEWSGRRYDPKDWGTGDIPNRCLSSGTACLYGLSEAAILAAGYAPAIGFLHRGRPLSFVYDIADVFKFETVVPAAFQVAGRVAKGRLPASSAEREVRIACREMFRKTSMLDRIIPMIQQIFGASGIDPPEDAPEALAPSFVTESEGDAGHRD
jgi:CRISPR-associated protein Cas1